MKKARMNISHSRFILSKLKIFGEIVTTFLILKTIYSRPSDFFAKIMYCYHLKLMYPVPVPVCI